MLRNKNTLGIGAWATPIRLHSASVVVSSSGRGRFLREEGQPAPVAVWPQLPAEERWKDAVDLMPLIDPERNAVAGQWSKLVDGTGVVCEPGVASRLVIPYLPPAEYDLKIVLERDFGIQDLDVILGRGGKSLQWMFGRDNCVSGFQLWAQDADGINNPTTSFTPSCLANGQPYTVVVQMRRNSFSAFVDGKLQSSWDMGDAFGMLKGWTLPVPGLLAIGANQSRASFKSIQLLELTGRGRPMKVELPKPQAAEAKAQPQPQPQKPPKAPDTDF